MVNNNNDLAQMNNTVKIELTVTPTEAIMLTSVLLTLRDGTCDTQDPLKTFKDTVANTGAALAKVTERQDTPSEDGGMVLVGENETSTKFAGYSEAEFFAIKKNSEEWKKLSPTDKRRITQKRNADAKVKELAAKEAANVEGGGFDEDSFDGDNFDDDGFQEATRLEKQEIPSLEELIKRANAACGQGVAHKSVADLIRANVHPKDKAKMSNIPDARKGAFVKGLAKLVAEV